MREIRTLRARWRGLETELRLTLDGHEGGNPGHRQGGSCGPPRQSSTLPVGRIITLEATMSDLDSELEQRDERG